MIGNLLDGRYEILRELGKGGMGTVYEARHAGTGRQVAVKVINADDLDKKRDHVKRFEREARAAGSIDTKHICQVIDVGTDPETRRPYMVMELMQGEDLGQLVRRVGPLRPEVAVCIALQMCRGLAKAHEAGVVHRDIKPANLYLCEHDGEVTLKILDFGIAKISPDVSWRPSDSTLTQTGALMGSPLYMSPEQARGKSHIDHRADLYSAGVVLYRLLAGRTPFQHVEAFGDLIIAICSEPAPPLQQLAPWVHADLAEVVHRALRTHPDNRFQSAGELCTALEGLSHGGLTLTRDKLCGLGEADKIEVSDKASVILDERSISGTNMGLAHTQTGSPPPAPSRAPTVVAAAAVVVLCAVGVYQLTAGAANRGPAPAASPPAPEPAASVETRPAKTSVTRPGPTASASPPPSASAVASSTASAVTRPTATPPSPPRPLPPPTSKPAAPDDFGGRK